MTMQLELFPTDVYLRRIDPKRNMFRFYSLTVQPTLFGDWALVRKWGRIGSLGSMRIELHGSVREAINEAIQINRSKLRRGYQLA